MDYINIDINKIIDDELESNYWDDFDNNGFAFKMEIIDNDMFDLYVDDLINKLLKGGLE